MPQGDVPGEWYSPTQPFPTRPPAYDRQGASIDDLIDFTPELRAEAVELVSRYKLGPLFTPPVVSRPEGPVATLGLGAGSGGTNWPGGGYDPETHILYVPSRTGFLLLGADSQSRARRLGHALRQGDRAVRGGAWGPARTQRTGTATGEAAPTGVSPPSTSTGATSCGSGRTARRRTWVKNHPALTDLEVPRTGEAVHASHRSARHRDP